MNMNRYMFTYFVHGHVHVHVCVCTVPDPGKGVCADPVKRGATLEGEGPGPPSGDNERQLSPDRGRGKN